MGRRSLLKLALASRARNKGKEPQKENRKSRALGWGEQNKKFTD